MIKFFRKIRQKLLSENKFSKYLIYAIGEIILVVIGILIALGINNKNQNLIIKEKERKYLIELKKEYLEKKLSLDFQAKLNNQNYTIASEILEIISTKDFDKNDIDIVNHKLLKMLMYTVKFESKITILDEIINSSGLEIISNDNIRSRLINWNNLGSELEINHKGINYEWYNLLNIIREKGSYKKLFVNKEIGLFDNIKHHKNDFENTELLKTRDFENSLYMFYMMSYQTENNFYLPITDELNSIIELIDKEIKK